MNIKKMLEYAKVDSERREEIKRFQRLQVVKEYNEKRAIINKATQAIEKLNRDAEETIKQMNSVSQRYLQVADMLKDAEANFEHIEDENEADFYLKNIANYSAMLTQLAQDIKTVSAKVVSQKESYNAFINAGKEATKKARELNEEYVKCLNESKAIRAKFEAKLNAISKEIDPEDLAKYNLVTSEDKYPPIHVLKENYCFCRIEMPGSVTQKVKATGWGICPDCGRILISEDAFKQANS